MILQRVVSNCLMSVFIIPCLAEPMKARLVNGTLEAGRLELNYNGEWGTVCDDGFGKKDAQVACKMLGFNSTEAAAVSSERYGQGSGYILLSEMNCCGVETSLEQCSHSVFYPNSCTHREDVGVICIIAEPMKARLVNGSSNAGRLEIFFNGQWSTVCNDWFRNKDAQVGCRMLGFNSIDVASTHTVRYGNGSGLILLDNVRCSGVETSLAKCHHDGFYLHNCNHSKDVGVICNISVSIMIFDFTRSPWISANQLLGRVTNLTSRKNEQCISAALLSRKIIIVVQSFLVWRVVNQAARTVNQQRVSEYTGRTVKWWSARERRTRPQKLKEAV